MELTNENGDDVACIQSTVGNGNTLNMPAITAVAAGVAVAALAFSAVSGLAAGGHPGAVSSSPTFGEVIGHFQGIAVNGMLSVPYPQVYQSFTTNFAFSTGLISWGRLQKSIDSFRAKTGGNLTDDNYPYLKNQATLVYTSDSNGTSSRLMRRLVSSASLFARDGADVNVGGVSTSVGSGSGSGSAADSSASAGENDHFVSGIQAYVEQLTIPQANTFMTVLLIFAIVVAGIIILILLAKLLLEAWAMCGKLPKAMESWRKRYWWRMAKAIINLILLLYGMWTLYCIYQFTNGDSWAAKILAGVTLGVFTAVLAFFTWRIYTKAHEYKKIDGDASRLYEDKEVWIKYSLFYDSYKRNYWLFFVPAIIYMFVKGCIIAGANGYGLVQAGGQLIVEAIMLILLLWWRPYQLKSGRWINIVIHTVRVASVACILIFVEELGISQTTKTITGVVLIVVQSVLTVILAILIAVNALITCIKENPHRRQRKEAEKLNINREFDNLTPLDARNSLLMESISHQDSAYKRESMSAPSFMDKKGRYDAVPRRPSSPPFSDGDFTRQPRFQRQGSRDDLVSGAASMGYRDRSMSASTRSRSQSIASRQPTLPDMDYPYGVGRR